MRRRTASRVGSGVLALACYTLAALLAVPAYAAPADFNHRKLANVALDQFIIPGYENFGRQILSLRASIDSLCGSPSSENLQRARKSYRESISAWGKVEIIQFGPVARDNRFERIFFWPDRKGRGRRQVRKLLSGKDDAALKPVWLAGKSVAVQGLTALEVVLFGKAADGLMSGAGESFACRYAVAIVENLGSINTAILKEWQPNAEFAKIWKSPGPQNLLYLKPSEVTLELVKALDHGLENLRDRRIAPVLGFGKNRHRKARPVLWRSKSSMALIHANIEGLRNLLFLGGLADAFIASKPQNGERAEDLMRSIKSEFDLTLRISGQMASEPDPFASPDITARLVPIGFPLKNIRVNTVRQLKSAAGLAIGFNASDGD